MCTMVARKYHFNLPKVGATGLGVGEYMAK